ncbi:MAG: hypothetical protein OIN88_06620 [Candidatus Methanoperedens sp.]|nr:hypothetical protein [Candidatus Methanoperedens sp.]
MVEAISKWLLEYFSMLYAKKRTETFDFQEAVEILKKDERFIGQILSELNQAGWITKKREETDRRKKIYQLNTPDEILSELGKKLYK